MENLNQIYGSEWSWFKSSNLRIFLVMILIFFAAAAASHVYLVGHPDLAEEKVMELVKALMEKLPVLEGGLQLFIAIFLNNFLVATLVMIAGLIPFLFIPIWAVMANAVAMGIVSAYVTLKGLDLFKLMIAGILPHGIFEIPAFLYACSLGVLLSVKVFKLITNSQSSEDSFMLILKKVLKTWLIVIIPLLLIAAVIETFITPHLIQTFLGDISLLDLGAAPQY
jgi:stage II sporulation protein M